MPKHSIVVIPIENGPRGSLLHPDVPTFTVSEYRKAHESGRFGCGSCGELMPPRHGFDYMEEEYDPDTEITIQLEHNFYLDNERPEDYVPAAEAPAPIHAILYEEGTRETYVPQWRRTTRAALWHRLPRSGGTGAAVPRNLVPDLRFPHSGGGERCRGMSSS